MATSAAPSNLAGQARRLYTEELVKGLAGILLGGMGSVPGAVVGGLILGMTESVSTLFLPTDYRDSIAFLVMIGILLLRPQGLFGIRMRGED